MAGLIPPGETQFCDEDGIPYALGTVEFYIPGTDTEKATYQDIEQTILNTNPVELDAAGRCLIFGTGSYRQVLRDALGNEIWDRVVVSLGSNALPIVFVGDGETDMYEELQAELDRLAAIPTQSDNGNGYGVILEGLVGVTQTIVIPAAMRGLTFQGGGLIALTSGFWDATTPLLQQDGRRCTTSNMILEGNFKGCAGLLDTGGQNTYQTIRGMHYMTYGWRHEGTIGGDTVTDCRFSQWASGDPEYLDPDNWTAIGINSATNDDKFFQNKVSINGVNFHATDDSGSCLVEGNHFFNGGLVGPGADVPFPRAKNIIIDFACGGYNFIGNYIGNGEIDLYTDNVIFESNFGLKTDVSEIDYIMCLYGQETSPGVSKAHPDGFRCRNWKFNSAVINNGTIPVLVSLPNPDNGAEYDDDFSHYSPAGLPNWEFFGIGNRMAIGASYANETEVITILSPNSATHGARIAFVDVDTDLADGAPEIGSRGNRMQIDVYDGQGLIVRSDRAAAQGTRVQMQDDDSTSGVIPYVKSNGDSMVIRAINVRLKALSDDTLTNIGGSITFDQGDNFGINVDEGLAVMSVKAAGANKWEFASNVMRPSADNARSLGETGKRLENLHAVQPYFYPATSLAALTINGQLSFEATSNTSLTVKYRGSDGVTRTNILTLS